MDTQSERDMKTKWTVLLRKADFIESTISTTRLEMTSARQMQWQGLHRLNELDERRTSSLSYYMLSSLDVLYFLDIYAVFEGLQLRVVSFLTYSPVRLWWPCAHENSLLAFTLYNGCRQETTENLTSAINCGLFAGQVAWKAVKCVWPDRRLVERAR